VYRVLLLFVGLFASGCVSALDHAGPLPDEPRYTRDSTVPFETAVSYEQVLQVWKTPEEVNGWIGANFSYDAARALRLSETQRAKMKGISIYSPSEFFERKSGVCVDLSRFAVETLRKIDPNSDPKYVMIEFDPIHVKGNTLRLHWLVRFKRDGKTYFFSDSIRPGHIAGPYDDTEAFISEYEKFRGRKIIAFRELESCKKQWRNRARSGKQKRSPVKS